MFDTLSRSWGLVKASAGVLRSDKELMLFPVLSGLATLAVLATFVLPLFALRVFEQGIGLAGLLVAFVFYFCQYSVIVFFNAALVGAAMIRLEGGDPTLSGGFAAAKRRLPAILGYAAIAATVGVLLQSMKRNENNFLVRLLGSGLGVTWTLATFLVVPVLVSRDVGPINALRQSVTLLKRTWGENAIGTVGIGAAFGLLTGLGAVIGVGLSYLAFMGSDALGIVVAVLCAVGLMLLAVYQAALTGIYSAALYRYAVSHEVPTGFSGAQLAHAFEAKR